MKPVCCRLAPHYYSNEGRSDLRFFCTAAAHVNWHGPCTCSQYISVVGWLEIPLHSATAYVHTHYTEQHRSTTWWRIWNGRPPSPDYCSVLCYTHRVQQVKAAPATHRPTHTHTHTDRPSDNGCR